MNDRFENFVDSVRRHGIGLSLLRSFYRFLRRFVTFEICRIESSGGQPYAWYEVEGYETRPMGSEEFHRNLCDELRGADFHWSFERGDRCTASLFDGKVVGYNFNSSQPTTVIDRVEFHFPEEYVYSFASTTAPSHRGKKLEGNRWKVSRDTRVALTGSDPLSIWYVNVLNLEARAANRSSPTSLHFWGYAGYIRLFGRYYCFNSPGCRKLGAGFTRASGDSRHVAT